MPRRVSYDVETRVGGFRGGEICGALFDVYSLNLDVIIAGATSSFEEYGLFIIIIQVRHL